MTKKLKIVDISEKKELEPMVAEDPSLVEEGMTLLGRQVPTETGPFDLLTVDSDGALCVIELKSQIDEKHLLQGLRYYDWVSSNSAHFAMAYRDKGVKVEEGIRLILVAPAFDETTKKAAKFVNVNLNLMEYICIELADGQRTLICRKLDIGEPLPPPPRLTIEAKLALIRNEPVKNLCKQTIDFLESNKIEVRPISNEWMSCWHNGKHFMYLGCKQQFFVCEVSQADGTWSPTTRISGQEDWDKFYEAEIKPLIEPKTDEETKPAES